MLFYWWLHKSSLGLIGYDDVWAIPSLLKIHFLLFVMFSWFCDSSYYIFATFFFKKFRTTCYLLILITIQATMRQGKAYATKRNKGRRYKQWNGTKIQTLYSSSKFAISSSNRLSFLSIASMALSSTSRLADRTVLSSMNTLWWTMSNPISICSVNPWRCLGDGDQTSWDDNACNDWKASTINANQCSQ